ncbi:hypothetical protein [Mycolicibacterium gadium]|uniref:Uncharacterized protein n=1 Tax=Mycolicibacterium gadium TaxID=1794 RepID=A0A7I7WGK5_MYCGU|nr:hypothetical protein [Mycolicibacterium gadium]BBZ15987.1 hypothetical protein MGAD_03220 [Mycolicibacterium gadium]
MAASEGLGNPLLDAQAAHAIAFGLAVDRFGDAELQSPALHIGAHSGTV